MFRLDTLSISPPNIQGNIVNYKFRFNALKEKEFYEPCKNVKAKAICKCGGDTGCAKIEPYYFQTSSNCKDYVTKPIAQKICNGEFVRDYCQRSRGCNVKHIDVVCPAK